jgi:integrase
LTFARIFAKVAGMAKERFRIVEFANPSGETAFRVTGFKNDGERVRVNKPTLAQAKQLRDELLAEANGEKLDTRIVATRLSDTQVAAAEAAYKLLPEGQTLLGAVRYFLDNYQEQFRPITVEKGYDLFIADRKSQNLRPDSIRNLEIRVGFLKRDHGAKLVSAITTDSIRSLIFAGTSSPVTRDNNRRAISAFFNWAVKNGYAKENPAEKIGAIKHDRDEPEIMPLADVKALLKAAREFPKPLVVMKNKKVVKTIARAGNCFPAIALGLFAALRPKEIERITWADIDLEAKTVTLGSKVSKMRERRIVELSDNLVAMLEPYAKEKTPLRLSRREFDAVKMEAGYNGREATTIEVDGQKRSLKPWPVDILRHTAISMHLAKHQHEGQTAAWAGNSPDIIQRHYKGLVKSKDAAEFWALS